MSDDERDRAESSECLQFAFSELRERLLKEMQLLVDVEVEKLRQELLRKEAQAQAQLEKHLLVEEKLAAVELRDSALERERMTMAGPAQMADILDLNVGGEVCCMASRATLCLKEDSMIASMFSGRWDDTLARDSEGRFFVDAPPDLFLPLLDFLRQQRLEKEPLSPAERPLLPEGRAWAFAQLLRYYGVHDLVYPDGGSVYLTSACRWELEYGHCCISEDGLTASAEDRGFQWSCAATFPCGGVPGQKDTMWVFDVTKTKRGKAWWADSLAFAVRSAEAPKQEFTRFSEELVTFRNYFAPAQQTSLRVEAVVRDGSLTVRAGEHEVSSKILPTEMATKPFRLVVALSRPCFQVRLKEAQSLID